MKKYTKQELETIRKNIIDGAVYCGIDSRGFGIGRIYTSPNNGEYIRYEHFGSSAIENNNRNLEWLLNTIFSECSEIAPARFSDYHINYIPIDTKFKGIDLNTKHRVFS